MTSPDTGPFSADRRPVPAPPGQAVLAAARESAIALLTDRFADDTLTVDEFEARLDRLYAAGTAAELDGVMRDLVHVPAGELAASRGPAGAQNAVPSAYSPNSPNGTAPGSGRVVAILSETRRIGAWRVPGRLDLQAVLGDVMIDLRDATLPPGGCEIDVMAVLAQVRVLVPPGVVVEDGVTSVMSTVRNDAEDGSRLPTGATRVRLTGTAVLSEIGVRVALPGEPAKQAWKRAKPRR